MPHIEIIREREPKEDIYFTLEYRRLDDDTSGFSFACDERGNLFMGKLTQGALENLEYCKIHEGEFAPPFVKKHRLRYTEPAIGLCKCGAEIVLEDQYMGACECPECGQWYNIFGQELRSPREWGDGGVL